MTNHPSQCSDTVGWVIGPVKHRLRNDLNYVEWEVKSCSTSGVKTITRSLAAEKLHWLLVEQHISYKLAVLMKNVSTGVSQSTHHGSQWHMVAVIFGCSAPRCALQMD